MISLHGIWDSSAFHVWGEESLLLPKGERGRRAHKKPGYPSHPFALGSDRLREAALSAADAASDSLGQRATIALRLPSNMAGPLPSPALLLQDEAAQQPPKGLATWMLPTLALAPAEALQLLTRLADNPPGSVFIGASLRYWSEAAKLVLELLVRGLFVPELDEVSSWEARAIWKPALGEGDVAPRLRRLVLGMPPVCRALDGDEKRCLPQLLVDSFLKAAVDAAVRQAWRTLSPFLEKARRQRRPQTLAEQWLSSLASEEPNIIAPANQMASFVKEIRQWTAILSAGEGAAFRTGTDHNRRGNPPESQGQDGLT